MIQFALISVVLGIAIVFMMRFISRRLWKPFDETLRQIENFRLESGTIPQLPESGIKEFDRLNHTLDRLMGNSLKSYRTQKEFTENASHELQTPLAVFQSKLDLLLQQADLTEQQAAAIQDLYQVSNRLSRLNRNLLLLAKIENKQYGQMDTIDLITVLDKLLPSLENLAEGINIRKDFHTQRMEIRANRTLLESLINNLIVNSVRHNMANGDITLSIKNQQLIISNTSEEKALDSQLIFNRFYRPSEKNKGNGLGLAIAKAICDYHNWIITYHYESNRHYFSIQF